MDRGSCVLGKHSTHRATFPDPLRASEEVISEVERAVYTGTEAREGMQVHVCECEYTRIWWPEGYLWCHLPQTLT